MVSDSFALLFFIGLDPPLESRAGAQIGDEVLCVCLPKYASSTDPLGICNSCKPIHRGGGGSF